MPDVEFIHTRLRPGRDDDIAAWYEAQSDKSRAVREAIRTKMRVEAEGSPGEAAKEAVMMAASAELPKLTEAVATVTNEELARLREAIVEAASEQMGRLPLVVMAAVREALASYQLVPGEGEPETDPEAVDPEALANYAAAMDDWEV